MDDSLIPFQCCAVATDMYRAKQVFFPEFSQLCPCNGYSQKGRHGVTWLLNFVRRQYSCNIIRKLLSRYTSLISFEAELHKGMLKADFQCFCYPVYIVYVVV